MKPAVVTITNTGVSAPIVTDYLISPFNIGFGVVITGSPTYTVQHTFDDPFTATFNPATATWFNHEDLVSQTTSQDGNYAFPVRAVRLNVSSGTGTTTITLIQAGAV
jgi:hypothetical protein